MPDNQQLLQNRYRIAARLGQGGMGAVYRAWDTRLNVSVAVKEMVPQPGLDPQTLNALRQQFQQEAQVLARLDHPHLVRVTDFFQEEGNAYLVMNYVEGESLAQRIKQQGAIPEGQVLTWAKQLLDALAYCHGQGIIHRDVKPQNVIIRPKGKAVLVDFGLVKLWDPNDPRTRTAMRGMGTPEYAPPEQYDVQTGHTDPQSDVYGLGATLYHALTGQAPPTATTRMASPERFTPLRTLASQVSRQTEAAVTGAMELPKSRRWQNTQEMAQALGLSETPAPAQPFEPVVSSPLEPSKTAKVAGAPPAAPPRRGIPGWAWAVGGLVALAILLGGGAVALGVLGSRANQDPTPSVEAPAAVDTPSQVEETPTPSHTPTIMPSATGTPKPLTTSAPPKTPTDTSGSGAGTPTPTSGPEPTTTASPTAGTASTEETATATPRPATPAASSALIDFEQWATWRRGDQPYGELTQTQERVRSGNYAAKLRYDFPVTSNDFVVFIRQINLSGQPNTVGAWVYGDGSGHHLNVWMQDAQGENWSVHLGEVGSGWRQMVGVLDPDLSWPSGHVSGPENGVVDYPVSFYALVLDRPGSGQSTGSIYIDDISVWRGRGEATSTPARAGTSTPVTGGTATPTKASTSPPPGDLGRIFYTIKAGETYYLGSTDPAWSQGQVVDPIDYGSATCTGSTATTLAGQSVNLFYGNRCAVGAPQRCPSPTGEYEVVLWEEDGTYSMSIWRTSTDELVHAVHEGTLNTKEPILWAPDGSRFYFTIKHTLHQASPFSAGYSPVIPTAYEPYLSPDGSMILYRVPVGQTGAYDIWVANADGSNQRNVTNAPDTQKLCARWSR